MGMMYLFLDEQESCRESVLLPSSKENVVRRVDEQVSKT